MAAFMVFAAFHSDLNHFLVSTLHLCSAGFVLPFPSDVTWNFVFSAYLCKFQSLWGLGGEQFSKASAGTFTLAEKVPLTISHRVLIHICPA